MSEDKLERGICLYKNGWREDAAKIFAEIVRLDTTCAPAWYGLSLCVKNPKQKKFSLNKAKNMNISYADKRRFDRDDAVSSSLDPTVDGKSKQRNVFQRRPTSVGKVKCPCCNKKILGDSIYCSYCGKEVSTSSTIDSLCRNVDEEIVQDKSKQPSTSITDQSSQQSASKPGPRPVNDEMVEDCKIAIEALQNRHQSSLDYSIESIKFLDDIGDSIHKLHASGYRDSASVQDVIHLSIYFGEVVRKNFGGDWLDDEELHKQFGTIETKLLMINKLVIDPFEPFFSLFQDERIPAVSAFSQIAQHTGKPELAMDLLQSNLAWICPHCRTNNMTPIQLRKTIAIDCPRCENKYLCITGEVVWGQCHVDRHFHDEWLDWVVRIQQSETNFIEVAFTIRNPDFTIVQGDFLVILVQQNKRGQEEVVYVENKSSGNIIMPGKE